MRPYDVIAPAQADTFVFHPDLVQTQSRTSTLVRDSCNFDKGMFAADTAAAVLAVAHDTKQGDVVIDTHAGHLEWTV